MHRVALKVEKRAGIGKSVTRKLRRHGQIPGVLYGAGIESVAVTAEAKDILQALSTSSGTNAIINLTLEQDAGEQTAMAIFRNIQRDFMKGAIIHVDLLRISMDKPIEIHVPLEYLGVHEVEKQGLIVQRLLDEVTVKCLPNDIPDFIEVDMKTLAAGESMHVSDITTGEQLVIVNDPHDVIASLLVPRSAEEEEAKLKAAEEAAAAAAEAEAAESENKDKEKEKK